MLFIGITGDSLNCYYSEDTLVEFLLHHLPPLTIARLLCRLMKTFIRKLSESWESVENYPCAKLEGIRPWEAPEPEKSAGLVFHVLSFCLDKVLVGKFHYRGISVVLL